MKMPRKWEQSHGVWTYPDFETHVRARRMMYVMGFFGGRPVSSIVVANMSYSLVTRLIWSGKITLARQTEAYRDWLRDELLGPQPEPWNRLLGPGQ